MIKFCIQIQPDRAAGIDVDRVSELCDALTSDGKLVCKHEIMKGDDKGPYVNLVFETKAPADLWKALQKKLYMDAIVGNDMLLSSMAMCTGEQGWDDYLLLYHFDSTLELDEL